MFAHPFGQFSDALWGGTWRNAFEQFAAVALATCITGIGNEIARNLLGGGRIEAGVVAEMLVQFAHHALPGSRREHRGGKGQVATTAFLLDDRIGHRGKEMAVTGLGTG
ncbi:MAG: hypothetical protein BGO63_18665 [Candidatus Accumulibacter sp. 66-26]|nr:MAG: hypothetical protein BGO63_18665 [Candidatus Accumulibacter sp. 66-26]